jgi:hypothetical protein
LLRERAGAAHVRLAAGDVVEQGADDGDGIDTCVAVETAVFDGEDRLDHPLRDRGERHVAPFLARGGDERGNERRVERQPVDRFLGGDDVDVIDCRRLDVFGPARAERDPDELSLAVAVPRNHQHGVPSDGELTRLFRSAPMGIAEVVEPVDDVGRRQGQPAPQLERPGIHPRIGALHFAVEPCVDHPGKADVEVPGHGHEDQKRDPETHKDVELPAPAAPGRAGPGQDNGWVCRHGCNSDCTSRLKYSSLGFSGPGL